VNKELFYCYSVKMKDFIKSMGIYYISKGIHPKTNRVYFIFNKSIQLDEAIIMWNKIKK